MIHQNRYFSCFQLARHLPSFLQVETIALFPTILWFGFHRRGPKRLFLRRCVFPYLYLLLNAAYQITGGRRKKATNDGCCSAKAGGITTNDGIAQSAPDAEWQRAECIRAFRRQAIFCAHKASNRRLRESLAITTRAEIAPGCAHGRNLVMDAGCWLIEKDLFR